MQNLVFSREANYGIFNYVINVHSLGQCNYHSFTKFALLVA